MLQQALGTPFNSELWKRLRKSINNSNGTYYCYAQQLFTECHPHALINGIQQLMTSEQQEQIPKEEIIRYCKIIADYITAPIQKLKDHYLNNVLAATITLACQHSSILADFEIYKFVIIKCVKVERQGLC